ncbi:MAG TPA: hypothetical protein VKH42_08950 [Vicinamibacterales bacterium]|nr:hypothetical protein [Vicinamibacterales bacterium]
MALGLLVGALSAIPARAQQPAQPSPFLFNSDAGVILNFVKADKTADFESVLNKLKEGLAKSEKPERKAMAAGWKVFKASESNNGMAIYVFIIDPVAKGQEYSVGNLLVEAFGGEEGNKLYKTYSDSYGNPAIGALLHLSSFLDLGK